MRQYWLSWISPSDLWGKFELHQPWWVSGYDSDDNQTICAAIRAYTEKEAKKIVMECYDACPPPIIWRFVNEMGANWSPFNSRFRRAKWMRWPDLPASVQASSEERSDTAPNHEKP